MKDFLIIGQGVAGSFLAYELIERQKSVLVIDDDHKQSSSMVSVGLINPITGKRFAITPQFDLFFDVAQKKYSELEKKFSQKFFESKPILRIFQNESERDHWQRKVERGVVDQYFDQNNASGQYGNFLDDSLGSVDIKRSGFCHTTRLLQAFKEYFKIKQMFRNERFAYDDVEIKKDCVRYKGDCFKTIIFCEGYQAQFNPFFDWIPFNSVKGEILSVKIDTKGFPDVILNKGKWCVPFDQSFWRAGATYQWDDLDCVATKKGKEEILKALKKYIYRDVEVIQHDAAVRPVIEDQKPVLGRHPKVPTLAIFNGLGSKGFLMAPFYASNLADVLTENELIVENVSIDRFVRRKG